jgi:hypothetical protein
VSGTLAREELESLRSDGLSDARREDFRASARATRAWEARHPTDLEGILAWIDALRAALGDPPVDRRRWREGVHRI